MLVGSRAELYDKYATPLNISVIGLYIGELTFRPNVKHTVGHLYTSYNGLCKSFTFDEVENGTLEVQRECFDRIISQYSTQGEVSLYGWPPAWLFCIQLLCLCLINNRFTCSAKSKPVKQEVSQTVLLPHPTAHKLSREVVYVCCYLTLWYVLLAMPFFILTGRGEYRSPTLKPSQFHNVNSWWWPKFFQLKPSQYD